MTILANISPPPVAWLIAFVLIAWGTHYLGSEGNGWLAISMLAAVGAICSGVWLAGILLGG